MKVYTMKNKMIFPLALLLFLGCETIEVDNTKSSNTSTNDTGPNQAPIANAGIDRTVKEGETINIIGSGSDSDGIIVDYEWYEGTQIISGTKNLSYVSEQEGNYTLTLNVYDDDGFVGKDTMLLTVTQ